MDTAEILNRIDNLILRREEEERKKEDELKNHISVTSSALEDLIPRIEKLCIIAEHLLKNGLLEDRCISAKRGTHNYKSNEFFADGFYHQIGFLTAQSRVIGMGIIMGGCCGLRDLQVRIGGVGIRICHHENNSELPVSTDSDVKHMERFMEEFPLFEDAFYKYVDSIINK